MGIFNWASGKQTRRLIISHLNAMLGAPARREDAARVLAENRYLCGYIAGRVEVIARSDSNLSQTERGKIYGAVYPELFPGNDCFQIIVNAFNSAENDPEFRRGEQGRARLPLPKLQAKRDRVYLGEAPTPI